MYNVVIIYFSGTGNTRYVAERLYDKINAERKAIMSIEDDIDFKMATIDADDIVLLYPICGGNMPIIMRNFLDRNRSIFWGKGLITVVTEAGFSGDGGALAYRYLDDSRVIYKASRHIVAPTNVSFGKLFKVRNGEELDRRVRRMNRTIDTFAEHINSGKYVRQGASKLSYIMGYHLQRKYFDRIEPQLIKKFAVDATKCIRCKTCIALCPMHNIRLDCGKVVGSDNCTLCYRCVHACPKNCITIIRHEPIQYKGINNGV